MQMIAGPCAARQAKLSEGRTFLCLRVVSVPQFRLEFPPLTPGRGALVIVNTCKERLAHLSVDSCAALWKDLLDVEA